MHHRSIHLLYTQQVSQAKFCPPWHLWNDWWKSCLPDCDTRSNFLTDLIGSYDPPLLYSSTDYIMVREIRNRKTWFSGKVVYSCHWLCITDPSCCETVKTQPILSAGRCYDTLQKLHFWPSKNNYWVRNLAALYHCSLQRTALHWGRWEMAVRTD